MSEISTNPETQKQTRRRRNSAAAVRTNGQSSREERRARRNQTLATRYFYYSEICHYRFDYTLSLLSSREFFLDERTISQIIIEENDYVNLLLETRPTCEDLEKAYPGFRFPTP